MKLSFPMTAVVKRELLTNMRHKVPFACLMVLVAVVTFIVISIWPREQMAAYGMSSMSSQMLVTLAISLLCSAGIFIPAMSANAFVSEKARDTYDLLSLTLVRPSGMIIAKLCNTVGIFFLIVIGTFPVFGTTFFLIGLEVSVVLRALCLILASSISVSMIGIFCSSFFRRTIPATIASYLLGAFLMGGWMLVPITMFVIFNEVFFRNIHWLDDLFRILEKVFMYIVFTTFPGATLAGIVIGGLPISINAVFISSLVFHGIVFIVMFRLTLRVLRRPSQMVKVNYKKLIDDPAKLRARRRRFPFYLIDPLRRKKPIEDGRNPMFVKEFRWGIGQRETAMVRTFYVALIICLIISALIIWGSIRRYRMYSFDRDIISVFVIQSAMMVIVAPIFLSNAFTKEYELGNIDMLCMTLLSTRDIIIGKIVAGFMSLLPLIMAAVFSSFFILLFRGISLWSVLSILVGFVGLLECVLVAVSLSLFVSVKAKRTSKALVSSYVLGLVIFLGLSAGLFGLEDIVPLGMRQELNEIGTLLSPVFSLQGFAKYNSAPEYFFFWLASFFCFTTLAIGGFFISGKLFASRRMESRS